MPQQRGLLQWALAGVSLLGLLVGIYLIVWKLFLHHDSPEEAAVKHTVNKSPDEVLEYWTADRKRKAKPMPLPNVSDLDRGPKRPHQHLPHTQQNS